jgi:hypothetical protein
MHEPVLLLSPDTQEVRRVAALLATALVCDGAEPDDPSTENSFGRLWSSQSLPEACADPHACRQDPACSRDLLRNRFTWAEDEAAADAALEASPGVYAAAVVFDPVDTLSYTLRMNHTALPPTDRHFSDVQLGRLQVTGMPNSDWKRYFFAVNLQLALDRSLSALRLGRERDGPLDIKVKVLLTGSLDWSLRDMYASSYAAPICH